MIRLLEITCQTKGMPPSDPTSQVNKVSKARLFLDSSTATFENPSLLADTLKCIATTKSY
jgi:hypothetical protein